LAAGIPSRPAANPQLSVSNGSFVCKHVTMQFPSLCSGGAANTLQSDKSAQRLGSSCAQCVGFSATPGQSTSLCIDQEEILGSSCALCVGFSATSGESASHCIDQEEILGSSCALCVGLSATPGQSTSLCIDQEEILGSSCALCGVQRHTGLEHLNLHSQSVWVF